MKTLSEQFEQFEESVHTDLVINFFVQKPYVLEIKALVENHYLLHLAIDKDATAVFIRFLNVSGNIVKYQKVNNEPSVIISLYVPQNENFKLFKGHRFCF
jgi:hypothetical protein